MLERFYIQKKRYFYTFVLNLCQLREIYSNLKAHLSIRNNKLKCENCVIGNIPEMTAAISWLSVAGRLVLRCHVSPGEVPCEKLLHCKYLRVCFRFILSKQMIVNAKS